MPVVDASVLVEYLGGGPLAEQARKRLLAGEDLWAPHLVDAEVGHVLRRAVLAKELRPAVAAAAIEDLSQMPLRRVGHVGLLDRAWALRRNISFYDALYVALAEAVRLPLLTIDARLERAPGTLAEIELIS